MMEKHKCKLCFRNFSNGRALGGHMRSHMMNLPVPPKPDESPPTVQLSFETESASSPSSSSSDKGLSYGLRENPKRSFRLVDPEFSFAADNGSVILQDRESETESSKNPTRRRSKRTWKLSAFDHRQHQHHHNPKQNPEHELQAMKNTNKMKKESWVEPEPASSVSDTTTEEDVAFCLMMLSRDKWKRQKDDGEHELLEEQYEEQEEEEDEEEEEEEEEEEDSDESEELKSSKTTTRVRGRYKCETCNKVFRSYQALGGHRASHKKIRVPRTVDEPELEHENGGASATADTMVDNKKIHECPVCFRIFASGQALGGHKRTHVIASAATTNMVRTSTKFGDSLIDLNLPAPIDDDDISQIEDSAVSDAEFVKSH